MEETGEDRAGIVNDPGMISASVPLGGSDPNGAHLTRLPNVSTMGQVSITASIGNATLDTESVETVRRDVSAVVEVGLDLGVTPPSLVNDATYSLSWDSYAFTPLTVWPTFTDYYSRSFFPSHHEARGAPPWCW